MKDFLSRGAIFSVTARFLHSSLFSFSFDRFSAAAFSCARSLAAGFAEGPIVKLWRPRHGCAAEKSNEIAPPHARPQAKETALYRLKLDLWKRLGVPSLTLLIARPDIRKGSFAIAVWFLPRHEPIGRVFIRGNFTHRRLNKMATINFAAIQRRACYRGMGRDFVLATGYNHSGH